MLEYDRTDKAEGTNVNKNNKSHKCIGCNYYYFPKVNLRFQPKAYDSFRDLTQKAMSFNDVAIAFEKIN